MTDTEQEDLELEPEENDVEDAEEMEEEKPKKGKKGKKELKGAYKSKAKTRITGDDDIPGMEFLGSDSNKQHHMNDISSWHDFNENELYELAKFGIRQALITPATEPKEESDITTDGTPASQD